MKKLAVVSILLACGFLAASPPVLVLSVPHAERQGAAAPCHPHIRRIGHVRRTHQKNKPPDAIPLRGGGRMMRVGLVAAQS